ncbi:MAG: DHHA1 domain-containing protein [Candidatus Aenigmatarchaeota archaeon]
MNFTIAHSDFDGLLSTAIILKYYPNTLNFFSSTYSLKKVLCKIISLNENLEKLFIADISPNEINLKLASVFKEVFWFDHHISSINSAFENVKLIIDSNFKSAASLVANYFNFESEWLEIADKIDTNNCNDETSKILRSYVNYLRKEKLISVFRVLARKILSYKPEEFASLDFVRNNAIKFEEEMRIKKEQTEKSFFIVNGINIAILRPKESIPPYILTEDLKNTDLIVIVYDKKLEFRSNKVDVHKIAKYFNGGGHKYASGAKLEKNISNEELLQIIEKLTKE